MEVLKSIKDFLLSKFSKIQLLIIFAVLLFAFVLGDSDIITRIGYDAEIKELKGQIEYYRQKTEEDKRKLNELRSDKANIEKFAREHYLMKKENEEIFIIN